MSKKASNIKRASKGARAYKPPKLPTFPDILNVFLIDEVRPGGNIYDCELYDCEQPSWVLKESSFGLSWYGSPGASVRGTEYCLTLDNAERILVPMLLKLAHDCHQMTAVASSLGVPKFKYVIGRPGDYRITAEHHVETELIPNGTFIIFRDDQENNGLVSWWRCDGANKIGIMLHRMPQVIIFGNETPRFDQFIFCI
jgi:hypothetical protein